MSNRMSNTEWVEAINRALAARSYDELRCAEEVMFKEARRARDSEESLSDRLAEREALLGRALDCLQNVMWCGDSMCPECSCCGGISPVDFNRLHPSIRGDYTKGHEPDCDLVAILREAGRDV